MRLISPENMDVLSWFNSLRVSFSAFYVPSLLKEDDWKNVANYMRSYGAFNGSVPSTAGFNDWRDWARAFYNNNAGG